MDIVWNAVERLAPARGGLGLYVHIPFCQRKCVYCDFNTYAGLQRLAPATLDALCAEIRVGGARFPDARVDTVFWGGGTPTLLAPAQMERLMRALRDAFRLADGCEITSEANPGSADRERFAHLARCGVNRISLGAQSFQAPELALLGRWHDAPAIGRAVAAARAAGVDNVNLDLMHGLPYQSVSDWACNLEAALALDVEHLSLYDLTVEPGTPLARRVQAGRIAAPDPDVSAAQYAYAQDRLARAGFVHYEIANWARAQAGAAPPGRACRHNLRYWRNQNYLGFGPGAHSHWQGVTGTGTDEAVRWWNVPSVPEYNRRVKRGQSPVQAREDVDSALSRAETMMLGLRLVQEGVTYRRFQALHGADLRRLYADTLPRLTARTLVALTSAEARLTGQGIMFHNYVSRQFLPARTRQEREPARDDGPVSGEIRSLP